MPWDSMSFPLSAKLNREIMGQEEGPTGQYILHVMSLGGAPYLLAFWRKMK